MTEHCKKVIAAMMTGDKQIIDQLNWILWNETPYPLKSFNSCIELAMEKVSFA